MTINSLVSFLLGQRSAIQTIATEPRAVWLGLLFVLSAGFAREYDGEDLLHEPWYLAIPLGASLATSFVLFCLLWLISRWRGKVAQSFWLTYRAFLSLYWMTAPLAWLYAIPYELWLSSAAAVEANLWTLALVASWRVTLMVIVVSTIFNESKWSACWPVLFFADAVAFLAILYAPLPILDFMGGVRLSPGDQLLASVSFNVCVLTFLSLPVWALGTVIVFFSTSKPWRLAIDISSTGSAGISSSLWGLAGTSILIWVFILPLTQPKQQLRHRVEAAIRGGRISEGLAIMTTHQPSDFPPHWDPPPRLGWRASGPPLVEVVRVLSKQQAPAWIWEAYVDKLVRDRYGWSPRHYANDDQEAVIDEWLMLLKDIPAGTPQLIGLRKELLSPR